MSLLATALVGLDLSRVSDALVEWLPVLQRVGTRRLLLYHVIPESKVEHVAGIPVDRLVEELRREALEKLRGYAGRLEERGFEVEILEPKVGDPAPALAEAAERHGADYIVVASRGLGLLRRILLGSVSDELVNVATRPVLVAKGLAGGGAVDPFEPEHPLAMGVAFDEELEEVKRLAFHVASRTGQRLLLIHVLEEEEDEDETREALERLAAEARAAGVEAEPVLLPRGDVGKELARAAEEAGTRLLIVGRGGRRRGLLRGSVADHVLRYHRGHVLVAVRPGES